MNRRLRTGDLAQDRLLPGDIPDLGHDQIGSMAVGRIKHPERSARGRRSLTNHFTATLVSTTTVIGSRSARTSSVLSVCRTSGVSAAIRSARSRRDSGDPPVADVAQHLPDLGFERSAIASGPRLERIYDIILEITNGQRCHVRRPVMVDSVLLARAGGHDKRAATRAKVDCMALNVAGPLTRASRGRACSRCKHEPV